MSTRKIDRLKFFGERPVYNTLHTRQVLSQAILYAAKRANMLDCPQFFVGSEHAWIDNEKAIDWTRKNISKIPISVRLSANARYAGNWNEVKYDGELTSQ